MKFDNYASTHVWLAQVQEIRQYFLDQKILSNDEVLKAQRFKFDLHRETYTYSRIFVRSLLGKYLRLSPRLIQFDYSKFGRPQLPLHYQLDFNISHSGKYVVVALGSRMRVGIDIEFMNPKLEVSKLANTAFSKSERDFLVKMQNEKRTLAFYRCWTRKEAILKAIGKGISDGMQNFEVSMDANARILSSDLPLLQKREWSLSSFEFDSYAVAFAADRAHCKYEILKLQDFHYFWS